MTVSERNKNDIRGTKSPTGQFYINILWNAFILLYSTWKMDASLGGVEGTKLPRFIGVFGMKFNLEID